ncbi:MAG: TatD family hydrolase [Actinomycetota bacterium]
MMEYLDTHCHITKYRQPLRIIESAEESKVGIIAVTELPSEFRALVLKLGSRPGAMPALGLHPLLAKKASPIEMSLFKHMLARTKFVGEVGLDFSQQDISTRRRQIEVFEAILMQPGIQEKILTVHSRRAETETIDYIIQSHVAAVLHWYSGPVKYIERALDAGIYFSINLAMMRSSHGKRVLAAVPQDKILLETDGPYINIGPRPIEPKDIPSVVNMLTNCWDLTPKEVLEQVRNNILALRMRVKTEDEIVDDP